MTEFDFKGALDNLVSKVGCFSMTLDQSDQLEKDIAALNKLSNLAARVQSGEMVVVPREFTDNDYTEVTAKFRHYLELGMTFGDDPMEMAIYLVHEAMLAAAPKHDWSE